MVPDVDATLLRSVPNPHFTYHPASQLFHLTSKTKGSKHQKSDGKVLYEAIAPVPLILRDQRELPIVDCVTGPISEFRDRSVRYDPGVDHEEIGFDVGSENSSVRVRMSFVSPGDRDETLHRYQFDWGEVACRIQLSAENPQLPKLGWVYIG
ncbi:UNVERIFIED_ORG: hypothetical protein BTE55_12360 [Rhizobium sophorae]